MSFGYLWIPPRSCLELAINYFFNLFQAAGVSSPTPSWWPKEIAIGIMTRRSHFETFGLLWNFKTGLDAPGEAKARKQAKVAAIRAKGSVTGGTGECRVPFCDSSLVLTWIPQQDHVGCEKGRCCSRLVLFGIGTENFAFQAFAGETEAEPVMQPVQVMPAPVVYQAMVPQYPTLLTPWRQAGACPGCVCCTNCVPHTVPRAPCVAYFQVPPTAPVTSNCEAGDRRTLQELQSPVWAVTPVTSLPKVAPSLPSKGSALHADGRCSPCAWFWKPQGCHHGEECGRCHLCPASEIKVRRKAKAMAKDAMRAEQSWLGCVSRLIFTV